MSYSKNATPIDALLDLDDIEGPKPMERATKGNTIKSSRYAGASMLPLQEVDRMKKFIRTPHEAPEEAGLGYDRGPQEMIIPDNGYQQQPNGNDDVRYMRNNQEPTCLDCANHSANCPVCKSYFNNDKTLYIIAIIVLSIICILLLKRTLEL